MLAMISAIKVAPPAAGAILVCCQVMVLHGDVIMNTLTCSRLMLQFVSKSLIYCRRK